jgi:ABC-2 type transport system ATP-binding protein
VAIDNDIETRAAEIRHTIGVNDLERATKRLLDYSRDFAGKNRVREAWNIRGAHSELNENKRKGMVGAEEFLKMNNTLRNQILELIDTIEEDYYIKTPYSQLTDSPISQSYGAPHDYPGVSKIKSLSTSVNTSNNSGDATDHSSKSTSNIVVFRGKSITKTRRSSSLNFTLHPIDITLKLGEITALVGENGSGKSTLLQIISSTTKPDSGELSYPCLDSEKRTGLYVIKQQMAYIPQNDFFRYGDLSEDLHFSATIHGIKGQENIDEVDYIIKRLGLDKYRKMTWRELSFGYKMRFTLAKSVVWHPKLLILDEPLANLDINAQRVFLEDLQNLTRSLTYSMSTIISSQHLYQVENIADNIIFLKDGKALYNGPLILFGAERTENSYEVVCNMSIDEIAYLFKDIAYNRVELSSNNFIIHTPLSFSANDLLRLFIDAKTELAYFRDISKSTRKLFNSDTGE